MKKNITKSRLKTFLVFFSFLLVIAISLSIPTYADQVQTPSCTCPKGDVSSCYIGISHTDPTTTIWLEKSGNQYIIHGGDNDGDSYVPGIDTLYGTNGADLIIGTREADLIDGKGGDDTICGEPNSGGGAGMDEIHGGFGNDYICGCRQDDILYGDEGDDLIEGNNGKDEIYGGSGNDCLYGDRANDTISGGQGDDYIDGGNGGQDVCYDADSITECENVQGPLIELEKKTEGQDADLPDGPLIEVGQSQTVNWTYDVTNVGNQTLQDITVIDDMGTPSVSTDDTEVCTIDQLNSGVTTTCNYSKSAQPGSYENEATASVTTGGETYTDSDLSHYFGTEVEVSPQILEAEITQEGDLDAWNSGDLYEIKFKPTSGSYSYSLEVTFAYPDNYELKVDYTVDMANASPSTLQNDPLILDSSTSQGGSVNAYIPRDGVGTVGLREKGDFVDSFTQKYDLLVDPQKLVEDYASEDILVFTVHFTVSDGSA